MSVCSLWPVPLFSQLRDRQSPNSARFGDHPFLENTVVSGCRSAAAQRAGRFAERDCQQGFGKPVAVKNPAVLFARQGSLPERPGHRSMAW